MRRAGVTRDCAITEVAEPPGVEEAGPVISARGAVKDVEDRPPGVPEPARGAEGVAGTVPPVPCPAVAAATSALHLPFVEMTGGRRKDGKQIELYSPPGADEFHLVAFTTVNLHLLVDTVSGLSPPCTGD